jgi:CDP-glycerol glycerophosphotransferase (TagB/SpsB family)
VDLFAMQEIEWIGKPGFADRVCVLNEAVREMFLQAGRGADEVVVTGNPAFDVLQTDEARARGAKMRSANGWDDGKINILWASQPEPEKHPFSNARGDPDLPYVIEKRLREFVAENDGFRLVVRYHPSQNDVFSEGKNVAFSPASDEVAAVIHACDMCITITSTVALEAHLAGKPVITVDRSIFTPEAPFSKMGISQGVEDLDLLPGAISGFKKQAIAQKQQGMQNATSKLIESIELLVGNV